MVGGIGRGNMKVIEYKELLGQTITSVRRVGNEELIFELENGEVWKFFHDHICSEDVQIVDVAGDLDALVGSPLCMAEAVTHDNETPDGLEVPGGSSYTWTFYKFGTMYETVTVRWLGESNGYYSEEVDFAKLTENGWEAFWDVGPFVVTHTYL